MQYQKKKKSDASPLLISKYDSFDLPKIYTQGCAFRKFQFKDQQLQLYEIY